MNTGKCPCFSEIGGGRCLVSAQTGSVVVVGTLADTGCGKPTACGGWLEKCKRLVPPESAQARRTA